jgi:hypothetical protein
VPRDNDLNLGWIECARKVPYSTRKVARDAATRLSRKHGRAYKPYLCSRCGSHHLATVKEPA